MKKRFTVCLLLILALFLSSCSLNRGIALDKSWPAVKTPEGTQVVLTVLTEQSAVNDGMYQLVSRLATEYMSSHENVTIELQTLPEESEEREIRLTQIKTDILAGNGPDLYVLPSKSFSNQTDPLFVDAKMAMYNGNFHDVSAYYNKDEELVTDELNQKVMNAGTIGSARYILPLFYDLNVLCVNADTLAEYGASIDASNSDMKSMYTNAINSDHNIFSSCAFPTANLDYFGDLIDYQTGKPTTTSEQLSEYLELIQKWYEKYRPVQEEFGNDQLPPFMKTDLKNYVLAKGNSSNFWNEYGLPYHRDTMISALSSLILDRAIGTTSQQFALKNANQELVAKITWWAAVGSSCDYADVAYDFLRELLTQDTQWGLGRTVSSAKQYGVLYQAEGYPVRSKGAASHLSSLLLKSLSANTDNDLSIERYDLVKQVTLETDAFPVENLDEELDAVRFETQFDRKFVKVSAKAEREEMTTLELAEEFLRELEYYLAEG